MFMGMTVLLALLSAGCTDQPRTRTLEDVVKPQEPDAAQTREAEAHLVAIEEELQRIALLTPSSRHERELAMEPSLKRAVEVATGTRVENKAVFYLANWRYSYREGEGVEPLLNRLAGLPSPAMKGLGSRLRVLLLLRQGRVADARTMAQDLIDRVPEFSPVMERVVFHETVGARAPMVVSRNLTGGPDEPVAKRSEAWLFYLFVDAIDDQTVFLIERYLDALEVLPVAERRLVCVTFDANLLNATSRVRTLPRAAEIDLLWANPNQGGNAGEWVKAWKLPAQNPHIALLGPGPDRTIMAVELTPESLRTLLAPTKAK
jgi:hypothetical protein